MFVVLFSFGVLSFKVFAMNLSRIQLSISNCVSHFGSNLFSFSPLHSLSWIFHFLSFIIFTFSFLKKNVPHFCLLAKFLRFIFHISCSFVLRLIQLCSLLLLWVSHFQFFCSSVLSHSSHFSFLSSCSLLLFKLRWLLIEGTKVFFWMLQMAFERNLCSHWVFKWFFSFVL